MTELETQIAKIQFGNRKETTTHVFVMAEQAQNGTSELYLITELPVLNPAALEECERISNALAASLRRIYRKVPSTETFENALAGLNEELGKLTSQGKTHWIGKLNALVAVKDLSRLSVSSTGKISALLFRENEFTAIAESTTNENPLKTFENFSIGKLHLGDIIIFSTNQLFNNISADRIKNILKSHTLPLAGQEILRILQENTGPEVAFGSILGLMSEPGTSHVEHVALEEYSESKKLHKQMALQAINAGKMAILKSYEGTKALALKTKERITKPENRQIKTALLQNKDILSAVGNSAKQNLTLENFQKLSKQKKFLFISAVVLVLVLGVNVFLAFKYRGQSADTTAIVQLLSESQKLIDDSNASLLYGDENQSQSLLTEARNKMASLPTLKKSEDKTSAENIQKQLMELENKLEKKTTLEAMNIATLSNSESLINLPQYIATQAGQSIVSFDRNSDKVEDNAIIVNQTILASAFYKGNQAVIYNGERLFLWNFGNSTTGSGIETQVPKQNSFGGFDLYLVNNRAYVVNKETKQVINYTVTDREITKPTVSFSNDGLSNAMDIAVDGNIYILTKDTILKFQAGKALPFNFPPLVQGFGGRGRLFTDNNTVNLYLLDSENNRILVMNKNGQLIQSIYSNQFTNPKDFIVDEKNKLILVLNDTSLLKLNF